jgi:ferredoxin
MAGFADGLVVLGKAMGPTAAEEEPASEPVIHAVDAAAEGLAQWLRGRGLSASALLDRADSTPAGQASRRARAAAVEAGLGTWGLNMAVLTPEFGPRVFFAAVEAELPFEPDGPLPAELCLGLEACGRCAAVCPETAIPMRAPEGLALPLARGVEAAACLRSSFQHGIRTACVECLLVCPVGRDYERLSQLPVRRRDLPGGVRRIRAGGFVAVEHIGPQKWGRRS